MPRGGSRARSGPEADPNSRTSERKRAAAKKAATAKKATGDAAPAKALPITEADFNPMALPARGRKGRVPAFPLPKIIRMIPVLLDDGKKGKQADTTASSQFRKRELQIWGELWKTPQAVAWERDPWRWPTIARYARICTTTELEPDASAALLSRERELRIECGLTPDGLKVNGWAIAPDQLAEKRVEKKAEPAKKTPQRRLRAVAPTAEAEPELTEQQG